MLDAEQIDSLCDEFENAWLFSSSPDVASFILRFDDATERKQAIEALIPLDIEYRTKAGQTPSIDDYRSLDEYATINLDPELFSIHPLSDSASSSRQSRMIGPYKLLQLLGKGGMGEVWMAEQERPIRRRVALKLIQSGIDNQQVLARFEAERQALALMDHPNIAKVLDAGTSKDGQPFFVMELVMGIPFTQFCDKQQLSIERRLELFIPVCHAVQHAHQKGIIHRDLKPGNVLIALYDGKPVPKVIDFGLAKALQHQHKLTDKTLFTEFGQVLGTIQYMSPEQAELNQLDVDTRTDIYSLGVILYELLTGSTPIERESLQNQALLQVLEMIREKEPPRPSVRLSSTTQKAATGISLQRQIELSNLKSILQGELDWIVMKAIDKNRARRYETATGLAEDLQHYLKNEVVTARPPTKAYLLSKFLAKHRMLFATAASILILLTLGLFGTGAMWYRAALSEADSKRLAARNRKTADEAERQKVLADTRLEKISEALFEHGVYEYSNDNFEGGVEKLAIAWDMRTEDDPIKNSYATVLSDRLTRSPHILRHLFPVRVVHFSPDKKLLATLELNVTDTSSNSVVRLWDVHTGAATGVPIRHDAPIVTAVFSPDGKRLATASYDCTARVWDVQSGATIGEPLRHDGSVLTVAFSPDGMYLATGSSDDTARIWDVRSTPAIVESMRHDDDVFFVSFANNGKFLVTASKDKTAHIWDAQSGIALGEPIQHAAQYPDEIALSPDGTRLAMKCLDGSAQIWDIQKCVPLGNPMPPKTDISSVTFSPDGKRLAIALDETVYIRDAQNGKTMCELRHADGVVVFDVAFSPDGLHLATALSDKNVRIWDVKRGVVTREPMRHNDYVLCLEFSSDGTSLVSGSQDRTACIWDLKNSFYPEELPPGAINSSAAFSPDGRFLATASNSSAAVYETQSGKWLHVFSHNEKIQKIIFSPHGEYLATVSSNDVQFWDPRSGEAMGVPIRHNADITSVALNSDGIHLAIASRFEHSVRIWNMRTGIVRILPLQHKAGVNSIVFSPDGRLLATASRDGTAIIWDMESGNAVGEPITHNGVVEGVSFSPDGKFLATACHDMAARIWDVQSRKAVGAPMQHNAEVKCVAFSADGLQFATVCFEKITRIWDVRTHVSIGEPIRHNAAVNSIAFSHDGLRLVSSSNETTWDSLSPIWNIGRIKKLESDFDFDRYGEEYHLLPSKKSETGLTVRKWHDLQTLRYHHGRLINNIASGDVFAAIFHMTCLCDSNLTDLPWPSDFLLRTDFWCSQFTARFLTFFDNTNIPWEGLRVFVEEEISQAPNSPELHELLGGVLYRLKCHEAAKASLLQSLELNHARGEQHQSIQNVVKRVQPTNASPSFSATESFYTHAFLALVCHRLNSSEEAIEHRRIMDRLESETSNDWEERPLRKRLCLEVQKTFSEFEH